MKMEIEENTKLIPKRSVASSGVTAFQFVSETKKEQSRSLRKKSTPAEQLVWDRLRNRKLNNIKFRRQQIIEGFIADFYCESAKLVVEVDGGIHNTLKQKKIDVHRDAVFRARGIHVLRITNDVVFKNISGTLHLIASTINRRLIPVSIAERDEIRAE